MADRAGNASTRNAHTCHAAGCNVKCPPRMFMCRRHWYMLPAATRRAVWAVYVPGQENNWGKVSDEYLAVTRQAIHWLEAKEAGAI